MSKLPAIHLLDKLTENSDTVVHRAVRLDDGASVLVERAKSARSLPRLRNAWTRMTELEVRGVPRVLAFDEREGQATLVLEDPGGVPLAAMLSAGPLPLLHALRLAAALTELLDALHRQHLVHKELGPHSVLVDPKTQSVHLLHFGTAARLAPETRQVEEPDALWGTLAYMAPEQTGRTNRPIDARTDLYALGAMMYEMVTGGPPFAETDAVELFHAHSARTPIAPHERAPGLPQVVSAIILKLLAKAAEDRYQTARGLAADLKQCLRQCEETGTVQEFTLGRRDLAGALRVSHRLFGRTDAVAALLSAFERTAAGATELVLVTGASGIGKSSLVHELEAPVAQRGGVFLAGKFEQLHRTVPYAAISQAFGALCRRLLTGGEEELARRRRQLTEALGGLGRLVTDLIPELFDVLGPQPSMPALGPVESQNRFNGVLRSFVWTFATAEQPLVLFLDDLQRADPASLSLLEMLLADGERGHLLVVGAYRDREVGPTHPFVKTRATIAQAGTPVRELGLMPLGLPEVTAMVAEALSCELERAAPLAAMLLAKTEGNPFFVGQLLGTLHAEGLLTFDEEAGAFQWDLEQLAAHQVTDNVLELMAGKIRRLSPATQRTLMVIACIGHQFELRTAALLLDRPEGETEASLAEARREGLILPVEGAEGAYRFLHDRVQQAAYSLLDERERPAAHLELGRRLRGRLGDVEKEEALLNVVDHLNQGRERIEDAAERLDLARLNLMAGRRAQGSTAYQAAYGYFQAGMALLPDGSFEDEPLLSFELHFGAAESAYVTGDVERAEELFGVLLGSVRSVVDRARVSDLRVVLYSSSGRIADAFAAGREGLSLLGVEMPDDEEKARAMLARESELLPVNLAGRRVEDLIDAPLLEDPALCVVQRLLVSTFPVGYVLHPMIGSALVVKLVNINLRHGHSDLSAYGYTAYGGLWLAAGRRDYEQAQAFGRLAFALNERFGNEGITCRMCNIYGTFISPYRERLEVAIAHLERGNVAGRATGDLTFAVHCSKEMMVLEFVRGQALEAIYEDREGRLAFIRKTKERLGLALATIMHRLAANLLGRTHGQVSFADKDFDEDEFVRLLRQQNLGFAQVWYSTTKMIAAYLGDDLSCGLEMAAEAERRHASVAGMMLTVEDIFYACLVMTAAYPEATPEARSRYDAQLATYRDELAQWTASCAETFAPRHLLVCAEMARVQGQPQAALDLYQRAIGAACASKAIHLEAIASELCGKLHLDFRRYQPAAELLRRAHDGYRRWGAVRKVRSLEDKFGPFVLNATAAPSAAPTSTGLEGSLLDVTSLLRVARAIASEIVLDKLLDQLLRIVITHAGAQRGLFVVEREGKLYIEAAMRADEEAARTGLSIPIDRGAELAASVVHSVARSREVVVLGDAHLDGRFTGDAYIAAQRPRSILCVPLTQGGRLSGVLYLENNLLSDAFNVSRVEFLRLLSAQVAIAIDNARLYTDVKEVSARLEQANARLEREAEVRGAALAMATLELRTTNERLLARTEELRKSNEQLGRELSERAQIEQERAALHEEVIRAQEERLTELSTPLIPISDHIMVMPLLGTMDARRAEQMQEAALRGAREGQARVVILDITGVRQIDAGVVTTLVQTASALRLLGVRALLTGIRPQVARLLVEMGADLRDIPTLSTLERGIAFAMEMSHRGT